MPVKTFRYRESDTGTTKNICEKDLKREAVHCGGIQGESQNVKNQANNKRSIGEKFRPGGRHTCARYKCI